MRRISFSERNGVMTLAVKTFFLLFTVMISTTAMAQFAVGTVGQSLSGAGAITLSARGGLRIPNLENVDGTPFLDNQYHSARIKTKSGYDTSGVSVKFNVYGNEMIFLNKGVEMALDSMDMVSWVDFENGEITELVFKTGFPKIDNQTTNTIYRVLADGPKYQLLKYYSKKLEDVKSMGEFNKKEFISKEQLYIYSPEAGIKKVKADKKALMEAFPELAQKVETLVAEKKLKLKRESDFAQLIEELNKP